MTVFEKSIYVFLISILPIVELRGAVPVGAALGLPFYLYAPLSVLGNLLPVPFILLFIPKILDLLERVPFLRPVVSWVRRKAHKCSQKIIKTDTPSEQSLTGDGTSRDGEAASVPVGRLSAGAFWALLLFVLIPLPGTGAWTGALVASLFNLPKRSSFLAITLGVIGACVIMTLASEGVVSIFRIFL